MSKLRKLAILLLLVTLTTSSLIGVKASSNQSIHKPSVPEFTVTIISSPFGSNFVNKTIELSIKNQPSIPNNGFFYNVRIRINDGNWSLLYPSNDVPSKSSGEYTNLSYPSGQPVVECQYYLGYSSHYLFAGDKVDFQVQAMIGSIHRTSNPNATNQLEMYPYVFTGEVSDWSSTQTITIPVSVSVSPSPTVSEFPNQTLTIALVVLMTIVLFAAILKKKNGVNKSTVLP